MAVSDLDGDGHLDLAFTSKRWLATQPNKQAAVFRNRIPANRFLDVAPEPLDTDDARMVVAADLNADGRDELYFGGSKPVVAVFNGWSPSPRLSWFVPEAVGDDPTFSPTPSGETDLAIDTRVLLVVGGP